MSDASAEKLLLLAILLTAIEDVATLNHKSSNLQKDAVLWVDCWDNHDHKYPYTFPWVCIELDLDPYSMRERIIESREFDKFFKTIRARNISNFVRSIFQDTYGSTESLTVELRFKLVGRS